MNNDSIEDNSSEIDSPVATIRFERIEQAVHENDDSMDRSASITKTIFKCPIVGHEVMEERAKFTVYKLKVENETTGEYWFVFRRYTDFVRLHTKLKQEFPNLYIPLPRKRWFGDNFNPNFIEDRAKGLQKFLDGLLRYSHLQLSLNVREFLCLDDPPSALENIDESRAIFETLEDTIQQLRSQLAEQELYLKNTKDALDSQIMENNRLRNIIRDCNVCSKNDQS